MPNWAEGTLKIRGTKKDVMGFLENRLEAVDSAYSIAEALAEHNGEPLKREPNKVVIEADEWDTTVTAPEGFYIKGTRRGLIEGTISFDHSVIEEDEPFILIIDDFKHAWGVDPEPYIEISREHNLDIRIYVFERGMEFNQEIEIHKGEVIKAVDIRFDDYQWECLMPNLGG